MTLPPKPIVRSQQNAAYQKSLDYLAERAAADDWAAVRAFKLREYNSYAKMVMDYRTRLLLAAIRQQRAPEAGQR